MKYYRIDTYGVYLVRKYAYFTVNKDNMNKKGDERIQYLQYKCPFCGYESKRYITPQRHIAVFCKDSVGDFTFGLRQYGELSFSEKALQTIKKYNITGIEEIKKYLKMETTRYKPITSIEGDYYDAKLSFDKPLLTKYKNIDDNKLLDPKINENDCMFDGNKKPIQLLGSIPKEAKLYFRYLHEMTKDIFIPYCTQSNIIVSERFKEMCEKEKLTNIINRFVEVYDEDEYTEE